MADECSKHPVNVRGYASIDELAEEIGKLNYYSNRKLYGLLAGIYKRQSKEDGERGNKQLSSGLEELSKAFEGPIMKAINRICNTCKKYLKNPYKNS